MRGPWLTKSTIGENLAAVIDSGGEPVVDDAQHTVYFVFSLRTVIELELFGHFDRFRSGSAPGYDCVTATFVKQELSVLSKPLLHVVNSSITTGLLPNELKFTKVIPIFK